MEQSEGRTEPPKTILKILQENPLYHDVSKLFHWENPLKSGLLFAIFNFFFFLITFGEYSILTLGCYLLLALLIVCFLYVNYVQLKGAWNKKQTENPFKELFKNSKFHVSETTANQITKTCLDLFNLGMDWFRDVFYCTNIALTLKWAFYLYLLAWVGCLFSDVTIIYFAILALFIWPRLYEEKGREIDRGVQFVKAQAQHYVQFAISKLPSNVQEKLPFKSKKD